MVNGYGRPMAHAVVLTSTPSSYVVTHVSTSESS